MDPKYCGDCTTACGGMAMCVAGVCTMPPKAGTDGG
jgi:hypothetical protein